MGISIWTDGSINPKTKVGGWAAILIKEDGSKFCFSGKENESTNNRMELMGPIQALNLVSEICPNTPVTLFSDSEYVTKGISEWIRGWRIKNFRGVKNKDLWKSLDEINSKVNCAFNWVRGHSGIPFNEEADVLAKNAADVLVKA